MPGGKKKGLFEITQWDPAQRYGYRSVEIAFPFKSVESTITLAPQDGGTALTFSTSPRRIPTAPSRPCSGYNRVVGTRLRQR